MLDHINMISRAPQSTAKLVDFAGGRDFGGGEGSGAYYSFSATPDFDRNGDIHVSTRASAMHPTQLSDASNF
jgi:hypothetical protein